MEIQLKELAEELGGTTDGNGDLVITGVAGIREAIAGQVTFLGSRRFEEWLEKTQASAIILAREHSFRGRASIRVADPYEAFRKTVELFHKQQRLLPPGIHASALIGEGVVCGDNVALGPNVVIGERSRIGDNVVILPGTVIGPDVQIGPDSLIYPNVVIREETCIGARVIIHAGAVIGDDGFGFLTRNSRHGKIPQVGRVVIEDDVEIGSSACIDRATLGVTLIRRGTRIDNLVQVGHNVEIGENSIICAQVGIAGSTRVGASVVLGGQVGLMDHIEIGDGAAVGAQGGVIKSVPPNTQVSGYPATRHRAANRMYAALRRLPDALKELRRIRERVRALEEREGRES
jgi:UDP-3-O-[3-hydroxymyristoyl] glucosamine N-acyltransferase